MITYPWNDRAGRFSWLRMAAFTLAVAPALWIAFDAATGGLGAKPLTETIHRTGHWAVRFLLISLALTPIRHITGWNRVITVRRMLGLTAFTYAIVHLALFIPDQGWKLGHVASEIVLRPYLTIGFVALLGLAALAATSTDAMIRRLGSRWQTLHRIVYGLVALGLLHFFMQSKINATEAALMTGFWMLLMGWRLAHRMGASLKSPRILAVVALSAALATALTEALWYGTATGVPWRAVFEANLMPTPWPRPAVITLVVGLVTVPLPLAKPLFDRLRRSAKGSSRNSSSIRA